MLVSRQGPAKQGLWGKSDARRQSASDLVNDLNCRQRDRVSRGVQRRSVPVRRVMPKYWAGCAQAGRSVRHGSECSSIVDAFSPRGGWPPLLAAAAALSLLTYSMMAMRSLPTSATTWARISRNSAMMGSRSVSSTSCLLELNWGADHRMHIAPVPRRPVDQRDQSRISDVREIPCRKLIHSSAAMATCAASVFARCRCTIYRSPTERLIGSVPPLFALLRASPASAPAGRSS